MKLMTRVLSVFACFSICSSIALADDLERLAGKWSVSKTSNDGQSFTQTIEIKKDKLIFQILANNGELRLYAEGNIKVEKLGPFQVMKITNIKAGRSASELEAVDDDRTSIYQLGYNTWTVGSNFDKERDQGPSIDVYKKVSN